MIKFNITPAKTISSFFQISFSQVEELNSLDLSISEDTYIMLAIKTDMMIEELNHIITNLSSRYAEIELTFEVFESLDHNILYIFN